MMNAEEKKAYLERLNLDQDKINKMIERAVKACFAYQRGEMTLKQVWYRARGERFIMACQFYPDLEVGSRLWELADEFFTEMGVRDYVIQQAIFNVIAAARRGRHCDIQQSCH